MKKLLSFPFLVLLLSCNNYFYHVASVQSEQVKPVEKDFVFENEHLKVIYNLWEEGGRMRFLLFNKTDQPIYIDWSKSFLVRNDSKTLYSQLPVLTKKNSADTVRYVYQDIKVTPFLLTARANRFTEIPSQTYVAIADFPIQQEVLTSNPKAKVITYTKETSPLRFGQQLAYSFDQTLTSPRQIEHSFWINQIQVVRSGELFRRYGPLYKGQPNALYAVEKRFSTGRFVIFTLATVAVTAFFAVEGLQSAFSSGGPWCC